MGMGNIYHLIYRARRRVFDHQNGGIVSAQFGMVQCIEYGILYVFRL